MGSKISYILGGISVSPYSTEEDALSIAVKKLTAAGVRRDAYGIAIFKKSVDARRKSDVKLIYSVRITLKSGAEGCAEALRRMGAREDSGDALEVKRGTKALQSSPLVVGMGPAGMFCALVLAENGYRPILIDRGDCVADRVAAVERFYTDKILDTESNIQFGAGGAGTFSDGKLLTRINDPRCAYVLETYRRFGAPEEITVKAKPHIGTDILRDVTDRILGYIESLGGKVVYRCTLTGLEERPDGTVDAHTTRGVMNCGAVVLALGHSARDSFDMLVKSGFAVVPKPVSVGVRIEHKRAMIEEALYGRFAGVPSLGAAEYALSDTEGERGVYTFCMCPGGEVVAAASEEGGLVVNGMSCFARDGENSNCAIAVSLGVDDYPTVDGSAALGAIEFLRSIERRAYAAGGGDFRVPVQTVGAFMRREKGRDPYDVMPTYMGGEHFRTAEMDGVLPDYVCESLRYGINSFDRKIRGFASDGALLSAAETRTSSPVRLLRGEDMRALGKGNIYPCGEGAGYAGGITSAAVDGIRAALAIAGEYSPFE